MTKTTTIHHRWLRFKRHARLTGPRAAQRRAHPWMTLPLYTETVPDPSTGPTAEMVR